MEATFIVSLILIVSCLSFCDNMMSTVSPFLKSHHTFLNLILVYLPHDLSEPRLSYPLMNILYLYSSHIPLVRPISCTMVGTFHTPIEFKSIENVQHSSTHYAFMSVTQQMRIPTSSDTLWPPPPNPAAFPAFGFFKAFSTSLFCNPLYQLSPNHFPSF